MAKQLLTDATAVAAGTAVEVQPGVKTFQASGAVSATTGSATVEIQGSLDGVHWDVIGSAIALTLGTTPTSDSFTSDDAYVFVRATVTAISGTDASVSVLMNA